MTAKVAKFQASKKAYLGHTSRALNNLDEELGKEDINLDSLIELIQKVDLKYAKVEELSNKIQEESEDVEAIEAEVDSMDKLLDRVIETTSRAKSILKAAEEEKRDVMIEPDPDKRRYRPGIEERETTHLPKLQIEKYSGDIEGYREFMDMFKVSIHNNKKLEDVEKFNYLKIYLKGDAAELLSGLTRTNENYALALDILHDNYGNEEVLVNNHVSKLINLPKQDEKTSSSLRALYNKVTKHVRELDTLGITADSYSVFLVPIVLSKLSEKLIQDWSKSKRKGITELLLFIHEELEGLESSDRVQLAFKVEEDSKVQKDHSHSKQPTKPWERIQKQNISSAHALSTLTRKPYCLFCPESENHYADECEKAEKMPQDEIRSILKKEEACLCCMKKGHRIIDCRQRRWLKCKKCNATNHHTLLHIDKKGSSKTQANGMATSCRASSGNLALMPQGRGRIIGPTGEQIEVNVALDIMSDTNFVSEAVSKKIGLKGYMSEIGIRGITGKTDKVKPRRVASAVLKNRHHLEKFKTIEMVEVPQICVPFTRPAVSDKVLNSKYLRNLQLADNYRKEENRAIDILIGLPSYWSVVTGKIRRSKNNPVAMESMLGWVLVSDAYESNDSSEKVSMFISTQESKEINENLKRFWELEEIGGEQNKLTKQEEDLYRKFEDYIKYDETKGKYEVKLPFKEDSTIADNKAVARRRFSSLKHRLKVNEDLDQKYRQSIGEYINDGYAEKVVEKEDPPNCYYIPNQIVVNEDRASTKIRLVFDASSHEKEERSLNDVLHKGPTLQPNMNSVIMRFRVHNVAVNADIRKMYLMIYVNLEQRDKLRFFWEDEETHKTVTYRNKVLPFGLRCSPFLAIATVHHHLQKYQEKYPNVVNELKENMYMDDLLTGAETEEAAIQLYEEACLIMKEAGMELVKWRTTSKQLMEICKKDNVASPVDQKDIEEDTDLEVYSSKLLGIHWNRATDEFRFEGDELINLTLKSRPTKRNILKIAPRLYDPAGWISPYVVRIKILFQSLWEHGLEWDENLPEKLEKKWKEWIEELKDIKCVVIPRRYFHPNPAIDRRELHVFGDASEAAYGAVSYLKSYDAEGIPCTSLVYARSKVAPVKKVTTPRLELLAAEMSAKVAKYVMQELQLKNLELFLWTDSLITYYWVKGTSKQYKTFVSNRVQNIQQITDPENWGWCPGASNPADLVSRGMKLKELSTSELWLHGPSWLKKEKDEYPKIEEEIEPAEAVAERKEKQVVCFIQKSQKPDAECLAGKLVQPNKYSKWNNLMKTTAYITRYLYNIAHKSGNRKSEPINTEDIEAAERFWIKEVQEENFPEETALLKKGETVKSDSKLVKLSPYYDHEDGLIKMRGRIQYAELTEQEKHPIILPDKSYIVKLLIENTHRKQLHAGINQTLVAVRDRFWVIRGRALVRRIVKSCILCRKYAPVRLQVPMAPIPRDRIMRANTFQVTGVDYTGPVYVVDKGGKVNKSYISLFTCATIRAVHIELVEDMTTDSFLKAFRRFVSRRGMPSIIYSDNAKTFKKASKLLKKYHEIMTGKKFRDYLIENKIEWKFIVERAPWWGGFYERLMRTLKQPLKKVLGRSSLSSDDMYTVLTEVEAMVNSRPLTFISDDPDEASYITPATFLIGREVTSIPVKPCTGKEPGANTTRKEMNKILTAQNKYLELIWKMWREEYVRNLGTVPSKVKESNVLKVGELVMVTDHMNPRCKWKVGIVEKVKEGRDGMIRRCWIKTATSTLPRPVQHVARLEMDSMEDYKEYRI